MVLLILVFTQTSSVVDKNFSYTNPQFYSININYQPGEISEYFDTVMMGIVFKRKRLFFQVLRLRVSLPG